MYSKHRVLSLTFVCGLFGLGVLVGVVYRNANESHAQPPKENGVKTAAVAAVKRAKVKLPAATADRKDDPIYLKQSPGAHLDRGDFDWGLGDGHISKLVPYPQPCREGD